MSFLLGFAVGSVVTVVVPAVYTWVKNKVTQVESKVK